MGQAGWERVDDATRRASAELLPAEDRVTTTAFVRRAVPWFARRGMVIRRITTDDGSDDSSRQVQAALHAIGRRQVRPRRYTTRTNEKADRLIRPPIAEWASAQTYRSSAARAFALAHSFGYNNTARPHLGLCGLTTRR